MVAQAVSSGIGTTRPTAGGHAVPKLRNRADSLASLPRPQCASLQSHASEPRDGLVECTDCWWCTHKVQVANGDLRGALGGLRRVGWLTQHSYLANCF